MIDEGAKELDDISTELVQLEQQRKKYERKYRALEVWGTVSKILIFTTLVSLKERSNEIDSE